MLKISVLFLSLFAFLSAIAQQDIRSYVKENTIPVSNIHPDSFDYADLDALGAAIGDAKMVMLGEQDHGDAPAFLAKTRIIKYLHEKKGFNVIAFEADFFGLNYGWDKQDKKQVDSFLKKNIFGLWTLCDACAPLLYDLIPKSQATAQPLIVTGFDNQVYLRYSRDQLANTIDSLLRNITPADTAIESLRVKMIPLIRDLSKTSFISLEQSLYDQYLQQMTILRNVLKSKFEPGSFWTILADNFVSLVIELRNLKSDYYVGTNARDRQMAENLRWLADVKYPNEKIIVWAHNYHISKYNGHFEEKFLNNARSMGTVFTEDSSKERTTYILGFTSYEGMAGRIGTKPYEVQKPKSNSFEKWIDPQLAYAFTDFKKYNAANGNPATAFSLKGSLVGMHRNHTAQWAKIFDGVFFIRQMYTCR